MFNIFGVISLKINQTNANMQYQEYWLRAHDGIKLFNRIWIPENYPEKIIVLIHGLGEHGGRYEHWAELFTSHNYIFVAGDLRGHGKSKGIRGDARRPVLMVKDILLTIRDIREEFPKLPLVLYGHSLGGTLLIELYKHYKDVEGLIITSPWLELVYKPPEWKSKIATVFEYFLPWLTIRSDIIPEQLTKRTEVIESLYNDNLVHRRISIRFYNDMNRLGKKILEEDYSAEVPVLIMQGEEDQLVSTDSTRKFAEKLRLFGTYKLWPENYHEIHNDVDYLLVFDYILEWLKNIKKPA